MYPPPMIITKTTLIIQPLDASWYTTRSRHQKYFLVVAKRGKHGAIINANIQVATLFFLHLEICKQQNRNDKV